MKGIERIRTAGICLLAALMLAAVWIPAIQPVSASEDETDLETSSQAVSKSSVKLNWTHNKEELEKADKWEIRQATVSDETGKSGEYQTVKTLKKGTKKCTIRDLKAGTNYRFQIRGYVKKEGKYRRICSGSEDQYTGIATPKWDDHALRDDEVNSEMIRVAFLSNRTGLDVKGYEIQRKDASKEDAEFKKIATVRDTDKNKAGEILYNDTSVSEGDGYQYRIRAYTGGKKKTYSPYSSTRTRLAVVEDGQFTIKKISLSKDEMVLRISSRDDNACMVFDAHNTFFGEDSDENEDPICIRSFSRDNEKWTRLRHVHPSAEAANIKLTEGKNFVTLKQGKSIYLKFVPIEKGTDLTKLGRSFYSGNTSYNGFDSRFKFTTRSFLGGAGKGSAHMNSK